MGKRKLIINQDYLVGFKNLEELHQSLDKDLIDVYNGEVQLSRPTNPKLSSLYCDARSYICAMAIQGNYVIKPADSYDAEKVRAILGRDNIIGSLEKGYKYKKS